MDEIDAFFSLSPGFKRVNLPTGYVNAKHTPKPNAFREVPKREMLGTEYVDEVKKAEMHDMIKFSEIQPTTSNTLLNHSKIDDIEMDTDSESNNPADDVYTRYDFNRELPNLPIIDMKDEILKTIKENTVVVIEGSTGCGKTTQVPQFILDDGYKTGKRVNIVVTQPRRIAAITIAKRVSTERGLDQILPNLIGYQVGLNLKACEDTRIMYVTTGVLLEKLIATKTLINFTHIILDEVHERSQDMDFLFIVIRKLLLTAPNIKIILMSATIEAAEFAEYFKLPRGGEPVPAPIIKVDKRNNFKVSEFYLCDLSGLNILNRSLSEPNIDEDMYNTAVKLIYIANRIDFMDEVPGNIKPTILIFLPGLYEISCMAKHIEESSRNLDHNDFIVIVLHSMLSPDEQSHALKKSPEGKRTVLLATNIAESSITVPDVKYVIDFCLTKNLVTDTTTNFTSLQLEWCSRSNCRQRAGRTGRTMDGRVYRLVPKSFYFNQMDESSKPEILRSPLEHVVLKSKQLEMGAPHKILALAMDHPKLMDIRNTILMLKETGALVRTCDGEYTDLDGDLTFIGHVMAALPVDIRIAKLIILGHCFSVLSECIIIGAGLTTKSIFIQGFHNIVVAYSKKLRWADGSGSDLFAILKAYRSYANHKHNHLETKNWTGRYFLNEKSLIEMSNLISEITKRLARLGIRERTGVNRARWSSAEISIILKVVTAGAFYPNYFVRSSNENQDRSSYHVLNGRNPCNTVYFSGFDEKFVRPLYVESIKKALKLCTNSPDNIQVTFDEGNEKVFVTFKQTNASIASNTDNDLHFIESVPGQVCTEVYKALKLKKTSKPIIIRVMHPKDATAYADQHKIGSWNKGKWECKKKETKNIEMVCLPRKHVKEVTGIITHYDTDFNRFWLRSEEEELLVNDIQNELNNLNRDIEPFSSIADVGVGHVVAAPYDSVYHRAKILLVIRGSVDVFYRVMFLDIGLEGDVEFSLLRRLRGVSAKYIDLPPRVFECRLASLQPSELQSARYGWSSIINRFKKLTNGLKVCAEIFSVENGVAGVKVKVNNLLINKLLIDEGWARHADENFMSKVDHDLRVRTQAKKSYEFEEHCDQLVDEMRKMMGFEEECDVAEPDISRRHIEVTLNGPKSPLESKLYSALYNAHSKSISIEPSSVNSILLEANPQDSFEKIVVAANVTENQNGFSLTARETTTMPNIPGFGPLMALIFSPYCEFFRDAHKSKFIAIICGLGEHPVTKQPLYAEHDLVFQLDAEIDIKDIENINSIRFAMDTLLQMSPDQRRTKATEHEQNQLTVRIKNGIIALLEKERPLIGVQYVNNIGWSKYDRRDLCKANDMYGPLAIFPFHNILTLAAEDSPERLEQLNTLIQNNKHLHEMSLSDMSLRRPIKCLLCHIDLESISELKIHLHSRLHLERENRISYEQFV